MDNIKKNHNTIRNKLLSVVLLPILILSLMIMIFGVILLSKSYAQNIQDELTSTTNVVMDCLDLTVSGDYQYKDDVLYKGDTDIDADKMLYQIKGNSDIDFTIFWDDIRIVTTIKDKNGVSAVGTKAGDLVVKEVLEGGKDYYSDNLNINGIEYIGYYKPLKNSRNEVIGMIFSGRQKQLVYDKVRMVLSWFFFFSAMAILTAVLISSAFSNKTVSDINCINRFLKSTSEGDLSAELDEKIESRKDELGSIGLYALKMRDDLKKMIETDPLTTLYNRRSGNNMLNLLESENEQFSLVMCDIDWFKNINDNYGHDAGDYILVKISELIKENVKDCGFAIRWGGEEFLLVYQLLDNATMEKVEALQKSIKEYDYMYENNKINITMTFGVETGNKEEIYEKRVRLADEKLYIGKNSGRDRIVC